MSVIPPGTALSSDISLFTTVQVAVTCAALYDHALALGREVELVWMKPPSLVTVLYVIERYLGDVVLMYVTASNVVFVSEAYAARCPGLALFLCFSVVTSQEGYVNMFEIRSDLDNILSRLDVYDFSSFVHGEHSYTRATMQLRIYAMYRRSRRILVLLLTFFVCEIAAIAFIIWREIGPKSTLQAVDNVAPGENFCAFSGINPGFVYIFIPFLCFESFLFLLAARVFVEGMKNNREVTDERGLRVNSFLDILARDSLCYFFVNLVASAIVTGLWQSVTELYANICVPFVMLLEVIVGTRLILDFRERCAHPDGDSVVTPRCSSLHFREGDIRMDSVRISVQCQVETTVVTDAGT
ncbi:hypothetical protein J3R83DRAFT_6179 [Lanmaoa asiatica]|nr:hypothetical protein J3R83DRAFT_6179 [Lanmaoa asiatica]